MAWITCSSQSMALLSWKLMGLVSKWLQVDMALVWFRCIRKKMRWCLGNRSPFQFWFKSFLFKLVWFRCLRKKMRWCGVGVVLLSEEEDAVVLGQSIPFSILVQKLPLQISTFSINIYNDQFFG